MHKVIKHIKSEYENAEYKFSHKKVDCEILAEQVAEEVCDLRMKIKKISNDNLIKKEIEKISLFDNIKRKIRHDVKKMLQQ